MRSDPVTIAAAASVALEGLVLGGIALWMGASFFGAEVMDVGTATALVVLTAAAAIALVAFGVAILRDQGWGRSGAIVAQLLILAVALGAATGAYAHPAQAVLIAAPALIVLLLVISAARRSARRAGSDAPAEGD
ncbi:histidine kinase [Microbacterium sp. HA-8]|uniref:histidine kinase n=1 Tax=Microbacterium sp. HA-8 TaxID=3234200 RepID=UPI0038F76778